MILEAMNYMGNCPLGFVVQSTFNDQSFFRKHSSKVPIIGQIIIKNAIKNGEIYLRPTQVNRDLPEFYVLEGWHVRNMSMRQDPITLSDGSVHLRKRAKD